MWRNAQTVVSEHGLVWMCELSWHFNQNRTQEWSRTTKRKTQKNLLNLTTHQYLRSWLVMLVATKNNYTHTHPVKRNPNQTYRTFEPNFFEGAFRTSQIKWSNFVVLASESRCRHREEVTQCLNCNRLSGGRKFFNNIKTEMTPYPSFN